MRPPLHRLPTLALKLIQNASRISLLPFHLSDYSSRLQFRSSFVKCVVAMRRSTKSILFLGGVASYVTNHFSR